MSDICFVFCFFFFKQKTAYEITYGDWSSDVCSSDLRCDFWHRENRQVRDLTDCGIVSSIAYAPRGPLYLQAGFTQLDRKPASYDSGYLENLLLRMFDEAQRIRTQGNALMSVDLSRRTLFSAS